MSARIVILVLAAALAAAGIGLWAESARSATGPPALHTIYCAHGTGPPVGFVAGGGLGQGCPPGFHRAG